MGAENGEWIMHGLEWDNPLRIRSAQELINYVNEVGFLPLFNASVTSETIKLFRISFSDNFLYISVMLGLVSFG